MGGNKPNGTTNESLHKFDCQNFKWELARQREDLPGARDDHTAVVHEETMILFGGFLDGERCNLVHKYEFLNGRWT